MPVNSLIQFLSFLLRGTGERNRYDLSTLEFLPLVKLCEKRDFVRTPICTKALAEYYLGGSHGFVSRIRGFLNQNYMLL